uniref:Uncharacterized protein n=1 Tax=Tetranychus urticae TaxID=32264 RepID=T1K7Y3_TETUR
MKGEMRKRQLSENKRFELQVLSHQPKRPSSINTATANIEETFPKDSVQHSISNQDHCYQLHSEQAKVKTFKKTVFIQFPFQQNFHLQEKE